MQKRRMLVQTCEGPVCNPCGEHFQNDLQQRRQHLNSQYKLEFRVLTCIHIQVYMNLKSLSKERNDTSIQSVLLICGGFILLAVRTANWASFKIEFDSPRVEGLFHNWEVSSLCGAKNVKQVMFWLPPSVIELKFNVDGAARRSRGQRVLEGCSVIVLEFCWQCFPSMGGVWSLMGRSIQPSYM